MNYLTPAAYALLPRPARCSLFAVYSLIIATAKNSAVPGQCDRQQESFARWLQCDARTIRRHEATLVKRGLLQVVHHGRGNRRILRVVELAKRPRSSDRESGQSCPHSPDRIVRTPPRDATSLTRRILSEEQKPERRAVAGKEATPPGGTRTAAQAAVDRALGPAVASLLERCGIHRRAWSDVCELARDMASASSVDTALQRLAFAERELVGGSAKTRGGRAIKMLRVMAANLEEKSGPRTRRLVSAGR